LRTTTQRLHDALRDLCERALASRTLPRRGGAPATILLTVPLATLEQRTGLVSTAHGGLIPVDTVIRHAAHIGATVIPIVIDHHGNPLNAGHTRRLASTTQRYALHVRDIGCVVPGCTTPGVDCDTHHLTDHAKGGPTDIDNLAFACPHDHQRIDNHDLELRNGRINVTTTNPDPATRSKTNTYFHDPRPYMHARMPHTSSPGVSSEGHPLSGWRPRGRPRDNEPESGT